MKFTIQVLSIVGILLSSAQVITAACEDSPTFSFGSYEYQGTVTKRTCEWITINPSKKAIRKANWCDQTKRGLKISHQCPEACGTCPGMVQTPSCTDSSTFTFGSYEHKGSEKDSGITVVRDCSWITFNDGKKEKRQDDWCGETFNGSVIGLECPEACDKCAPCEDSSTFIFGSRTYNGETVTQNCAYITANPNKIVDRQARFCSGNIDGVRVSKKCPVACGKCEDPNAIAPVEPPVAAPVCSDSSSFTFGSYNYKGSETVRDCAWISVNDGKKEIRQNNWCSEKIDGVRVSKKCPVACGKCDDPNAIAPVEPPVAAPVEAPVAKPVVEECNLVATLGYPIDSPDDAPYYGYHADYMEVTKVGDDENECSWTNAENLPHWCTYKNSGKGDSAYIANIDDEYDDKWEDLWTETIKIKKASGNSYKFEVTHWFLDEDYYKHNAKWKDHLMAAVLKIENKSHASQGSLKKSGWTHPVDEDVPTHIKKDGKWVPNPKYKGKFEVTVSCNNNCYCQSSYEVL